MALPIKIPSVYKRTPLVQNQDPLLYSMSSTKISNEIDSVLGVPSVATIDILINKIDTNLSIVLRYMDMNSSYLTTSFLSLKEEYYRQVRFMQADKSKLNGLASANVKLTETEKLRESLFTNIRTLSKSKAQEIRALITTRVISNSLKEEILNLISEVTK